MVVAYQPGRSALLKYGSQTSPESYTTVGGLRNCDVSIDAGPVDVTNKDSAGYQKMLAGAGVWKMTITAQGLFDNSAPLKAIIAAANPSQLQFYAEIVFGNADIYVGQWVITSIKRTGSYQDAETYDLTITSSGTITFTPGT